jgi:subtilisin family serine protease
VKNIIPSAFLGLMLLSALSSAEEVFDSKQWAWEAINVNEAWEITRGSEDVIIAIIDTGIYLDHPKLKGNIWTNPLEVQDNGKDDDGNGYIDDIHGWDCFEGDPFPQDLDGHGTHLAGIIAAKDQGAGVVGLNENVRLLPLRVGLGNDFPWADLIEAINYAVMMKSRYGLNIVAIHNAYGGPIEDKHTRELLYQVIKSAEEADILFIAAAGNKGSNNDNVSTGKSAPVYPSDFDLDNIISVAGTTPGDGIYPFSNYGSISVDLGAPAASIISTGFEADVTRTGTSMSVAMVAGTVGLIKAANPSLNYREIRSILLDNVDLVPALVGKVATNGRLNVGRSVKAASGK